MKKAKVLAFIAAFTLLASAFSGCTKGSNTSSGTSSTSSTVTGTTTINFYGGWTGADLDKMTALVESFNSSQNAIKVNFTSQQWSQMFTKFLADYQAGSSPEVVAMHTFEMGQFANMGV